MFNTKARLSSVVPLVWFSIALVIVYQVDRQQAYLGQISIVAALFTVGTYLSFKMLRDIPRIGADFFDPGILFVVFVFLTLGPVAITTALLVPIRGFEASALSLLLAKVTWLHLTLLLPFSFTYYALARLVPPTISQYRNPAIWTSSAWIWLALALTIISFSVEGSLGLLNTRGVGDSNDISLHFTQSTGLLEGQALLHLRRMRGLAIAIAVGVFSARAPSIRIAQFRLLIVTGILGVIYFSVFASRGFLFSTALGAAAYADVVRWRGQFLNWKTFAIGIVAATALLQILTVLEALLLQGIIPSLLDLAQVFILDFGIIENSAYVVDWVDRGIAPMQHGKSYLTAFLSIFPTQMRGQLVFLPDWFAATLSQQHGFDYVGMGVGFGFSGVAEGYINWGSPGVVVQGIVLGALGFLIRITKITQRLRLFTPFLFSATVMLSYVLFRMDTAGMISRFRNVAIDTVAMVILVLIIHEIGQRASRGSDQRNSNAIKSQSAPVLSG